MSTSFGLRPSETIQTTKMKTKKMLLTPVAYSSSRPWSDTRLMWVLNSARAWKRRPQCESASLGAQSYNIECQKIQWSKPTIHLWSIKNHKPTQWSNPWAFNWLSLVCCLCALVFDKNNTFDYRYLDQKQKESFYLSLFHSTSLKKRE